MSIFSQIKKKKLEYKIKIKANTHIRNKLTQGEYQIEEPHTSSCGSFNRMKEAVKTSMTCVNNPVVSLAPLNRYHMVGSLSGSLMQTASNTAGTL